MPVLGPKRSLFLLSSSFNLRDTSSADGKPVGLCTGKKQAQYFSPCSSYSSFAFTPSSLFAFINVLLLISSSAVICSNCFEATGTPPANTSFRNSIARCNCGASVLLICADYRGAGMRWRQRIWTILSTREKQHNNVFDFLHRCLLAHWANNCYPELL